MNAPLDDTPAADPRAANLPFDAKLLDRLLDEAGIDVLVVTSKHNIQYLIGGYRFFFFDHFDAIGVSRYLPVLIYPKGEPARAVYLGHGMEKYEQQLGKFWMQEFEPVSRLGRRHAGGDQAPAPARPGNDADRRRAGLPAGGRREHAQERAAAGGARRGAGPARAAAGAQDPGGAPAPQAGLRARHRFDARGHRQARAGRDQARADRGAPHRGSAARAGLRILPADRRHQPEPRTVGSGPRRGRHLLARTRAGTTTAISATSAGWGSWASRTRSSRISSPRST